MASFDQFAMPSSNMGLPSGMMPDDVLTEQEMFDSTLQMPQAAGSEFAIPSFDIVDMDSVPMLPASTPGMLPMQANDHLMSHHTV